MKYWSENGQKIGAPNGGAVSTDYLYMMALVTLGYQWAQVARTCENQLSNPDDDSFDRQFYRNKLVCAEFFMEKVLPETMAHLAKIQAGADSLIRQVDEAFQSTRQFLDRHIKTTEANFPAANKA